MSLASKVATARFVGAFFDEFVRWGVRDVVISPGSRSTPLAMVAYEMSRRNPQQLRIFVDVDERGAAFFALGIAKASGRPVAVICTSGTAVANYYPAVLEAEASRVGLIVLSGDRPATLQGCGAPQTCDQLHLFGSHVRSFRQMPLPSEDSKSLLFARQAARESVIAAGAESASLPPEALIAGFSLGGPVQVNFPFEEPLTPDITLLDLFEGAKSPSFSFTQMQKQTSLSSGMIEELKELFQAARVLILAGEGTCLSKNEARLLIEWAQGCDIPVFADVLSGLRGFAGSSIVDSYDTVIEKGGLVSEGLQPSVVVRFGQYPVSKKVSQLIERIRPLQIVVDPYETRDFTASTHIFVRCCSHEFVASFGGTLEFDEERAIFATRWQKLNEAARLRIEAGKVEPANDFEGSFVSRMIDCMPEGSSLFVANSMSVRALDTFLTAGKQVRVFCNRGLNGIDGTLSTALGVAQSFKQTTFLAGDLTLLHDINALALQRELRIQKKTVQAVEPEAVIPSIVIVLLNNNGGAIFDMLPQKSSEDYFERLFLTPQDVNFEAAAHTFAVPYARAETLDCFEKIYREFLETPGITLLEIPVPLQGIKERYAPFWSLA